MHILRQVCPILNLRPLRRLLDLHDVPYSEDDTLKKLRFRPKAFLKRLKASKYPPGSASLLGSAKKARARESTRLREQWPQLVPDALKQRLLDQFGLRVSSQALRTFIVSTVAAALKLAPSATEPLSGWLLLTGIYSAALIVLQMRTNLDIVRTVAAPRHANLTLSLIAMLPRPRLSPS
ncbi:hypothetical protein DFH09DRAFT_1305949 [Mycena vulgaris]|nr:hypothetical protein DFH09DRAFT_1305949 [Mycena vulgaris]